MIKINKCITMDKGSILTRDNKANFCRPRKIYFLMKFPFTACVFAFISRVKEVFYKLTNQ